MFKSKSAGDDVSSSEALSPASSHVTIIVIYVLLFQQESSADDVSLSEVLSPVLLLVPFSL